MTFIKIIRQDANVYLLWRPLRTHTSCISTIYTHIIYIYVYTLTATTKVSSFSVPRGFHHRCTYPMEDKQRRIVVEPVGNVRLDGRNVLRFQRRVLYPAFQLVHRWFYIRNGPFPLVRTWFHIWRNGPFPLISQMEASAFSLGYFLPIKNDYKKQ